MLANYGAENRQPIHPSGLILKHIYLKKADFLISDCLTLFTY